MKSINNKVEEIDADETEQILGVAAAVDVAKASGMVCVRYPHPSIEGRRMSKVREVDSTTNSLLALGEGLVALGVERVALESTSDYWRPFFYLLEAAGLSVWLVNARDVKQVTGRPKTDKLDAVWLAKLNEQGMLRPSFVPLVRSGRYGTTPGCGPSWSTNAPERSLEMGMMVPTSSSSDSSRRVLDPPRDAIDASPARPQTRVYIQVGRYHRGAGRGEGVQVSGNVISDRSDMRRAGRLQIRHYERLVVHGRRRLIQPNWWMLPAVVFVVWRAIDEGRFWLYSPIGLAGIILGIWMNTRRSDDPEADSMGE